MQVDFVLPTGQDVDRELEGNLVAFSILCELGPVRFPSIGITALTILDTAERLPAAMRLLYLQRVVQQLTGWINDEINADPARFEYPAAPAERFYVTQGGG